MTIEIQQPELEALIRDRMASGNFASIEDFLRRTLDPAPITDMPQRSTPRRTGAEIIEAMQRMPYKDEIDLEPERYVMPISDPVTFE